MDTAETVVLIAGALLIVATLWFFFGESWSERKAARKLSKDNAPTAKSSTTAPLYACPMHPWITSKKAGGICSICGMQLVRNEET